MNGAKMISLWQPFATLMAIGAKSLETRGNATSHRGLTFIQATKRAPKYGDKFGDYGIIGGPKTCDPNFHLEHRHYDGIWHRMVSDGQWLLPLGCVVAVGDLVDVIPIESHETLIRFPRHGSRAFIADDAGLGLWEYDKDDGVCVDGPGWNAVGHEYEHGGEKGDQLPFGDFRPGRFAHIHENVVALPEPVPARGHQSGYRDIDPEVYAAVMAQIEVPA